LSSSPQNTLVTRSDSGAPNVPQPVSISESKEDMTKTQSEIIKSRFLVGKVVDELSLDKDNQIRGPFKREKAVNSLLRRIDITQVRDSDLYA